MKEKNVIKYLFKKTALVIAVLSLGACHKARLDPVVRAQEWQPEVNMPTSVVVCRSKQCAPAALSMSKEYIYNSLMTLFEHNAHEKALICRADPFSHTCTDNYLALPITVGVTPAHLFISDVEFEDVSIALNRQSIVMSLNYGVSYNGQTPVCKPAKTLVYVKNAKNVVLEDSGYMCKMTTIGNTTIKTLFAIDYIDLDYGYIGGYYSIGLSGPAFGGKSGYMLIRLKNDAHPLSPELILKEKAPEPEINPFLYEECYSPELVPMPCYEELPCYRDEGLGKVICPQPEAPEYTLIDDYSSPEYRSKGVSMPKAVDNVKNKTAVDTKNVNTSTTGETTMSVYSEPVSQDVKATKYKGVEVFPIYQKKKK